MASKWRATLDFLTRRKRNYQAAFTSPAGLEVLADLAVFCRANETCFHEDARLHAVAEGRREVFLRIQKHLHLSSEQLHALYAGKPIPFQIIEDEQT
jgi:hypothetical protein